MTNTDNMVINDTNEQSTSLTGSKPSNPAVPLGDGSSPPEQLGPEHLGISQDEAMKGKEILVQPAHHLAGAGRGTAAQEIQRPETRVEYQPIVDTTRGSNSDLQTQEHEHSPAPLTLGDDPYASNMIDREPEWETQPNWEPSAEILENLASDEDAQGRGNSGPFSATNWSAPEDGFSATFYEKYRSQLWFPEEIPLSNDAQVWKGLSDAERRTYSQASAGLNALDTLQGEIGMSTLHSLVQGHTRKATLQFQAMMEDVHARSYSLMNKTFLSASEEREIFQWIENQPQLQFKIRMIQAIMMSADRSRLGIWKKMAMSCMLETALFYSGFFYPLYLAGQGKMTATGEIFNLIILDEAVHGVYVSMLAQEIFNEMGEREQERATNWYRNTVETLYRNEVAYTENLYDEIGLTHEVKSFIRWNFNVLADNLGMPRMFGDQEINPIVQNGLRTRSTTHDFFSSKGNSYAKIEVEPLHDEDVLDAWNVEPITENAPR